MNFKYLTINNHKINNHKYQAKLIKSSLGLPKCCRNNPLLKALSIKKIERILQVQQLTEWKLISQM